MTAPGWIMMAIPTPKRCARPSATGAATSAIWTSKSRSRIRRPTPSPGPSPSAPNWQPDTELLEWVCNENGGRGLEHWVGKASDEKKSEVKVAPEILAKYVGTYQEQPPLCRLVPRVVQITLSGDTLFADMDGRGKVPLTGESETGFTGLYGLGVEFAKDSSGGPMLYVKHVSGDYRFLRK